MSRRPDPRSAAVTVALAAAVVIGLGALPSAGQTDGETGIPSVADARAAVERAEATQAQLDRSLAELTAERDRLLSDLSDRDGRRERATEDLLRARTGARSLAVLAYMTADVTTTVVGLGTDTEGLYRDTLLRDGADARLQAAAYYQDLREQADVAVTGTLNALDGIEAEIQALSASRDLAVDDLRAASSDLAAAEAEAAAAAAEQARAEAERRDAAARADLPDPPPVGDGPWIRIGSIPGGPSAEQWARLRSCESGGDYQAVSASGAYRGAYQFDLSTWRTMGGSGDPIAASPAEQDHRAQLLWQSRGSAPWPICGRHLR